jgi:ribosomal protein S18 acetylase RimI-like enzyme
VVVEELCNLATDPKHERRGAGSQLIRWVFDKADSMQAWCYLDTGIDGVGKAFYEKLGFYEVDRCDFDLEKYGGIGKDSLMSMIRDPKAPA